MTHLLQALAQHWHLSASQYWQLRLLCAITIGPLLGVFCLILFKKSRVAARVVRIKRTIRVISRRPTISRPLPPIAG